MPEFEQPNISLQGGPLHQRWAGLDTLLIDIVPRWLCVNNLCFDLILSEQTGRSWRVPAGKQFAPQVFHNPFNIGVVIGAQLHSSAWITLSDEDDNVRYLPRYKNLLYKEGHMELDVPVLCGGVVYQLCCLSVHSVIKHRMRVVTVRERFSLSSKLHRAVPSFSCLCVPLDTHTTCKPHIPDDTESTTGIRVKQEIVSLLLWNVVSDKPVSVSESMKLSFVPYLRARFADDKMNESSCLTTRHVDSNEWSFPCKLKSSEAGRRLFMELPCRDAESGVACCVISQTDCAVVYLLLSLETHSDLMLHNSCPAALCFGLSASEPGRFTGAVIDEELEPIANLPRVEARHSRQYSLPHSGTQFPSVSITVSTPRLYLSSPSPSSTATPSPAHTQWSQSIDLSADNKIFVVIPDVFDVKVAIRRLCHTVHVHIDPVSRAEISAKEVRSRISSKVITETKAKPELTKPVSIETRSVSSELTKPVSSELTKPISSRKLTKLVPSDATHTRGSPYERH